MTEISVELQKEREKNSELLKKISSLEAQIKEKEKASVTSTAEEDDPSSSYRIIEEFKRQKIYTINDVYEDGTRSRTKLDSSHIESIEEKDINLHHPIVNWISFDETQFLSDKTKDEDSIVGFNEINDGDDEEYQGLSEINNGKNTKMDPKYDEKEFNRDQSRGILIVDDIRLHRNIFPTERSEIKKCHSKERKGITKDKEPFEIHHFQRMFPQKGSESLSSFKPLKLPFCPKEVKRIMECEALLSKNAQSHTIRKIIVFASLGIRHGYVDVYELDFSHFTILRKGEPYVSPKDPGEHVLYENPGVGKKVFYPNRKNPILCPVQVLEQEKLMRPSDPSCPSCLFLCIKYGGRTRNLPQNEYVRQRMGRNKLKSFGPLMCQMASLVHVRSGSFFFKALGITLLFMAGFPDFIVQRETKYRNLDLLQKYYRTDEEAEGEDLVHPYPLLDKPRIDLHNYFGKSTSSESTLQRKKQVPLITKPQNLQKSTLMSPIPSTTINPTPLGLKNYASTHTTPQPIKFHLPSHDLANATASILRINPMFSVYARRNPAVYPTFLPNPLTNRFVPLSFWHHPNYMYSSSYGYQCFPYSVNRISNGSRILCDHISEKHYFSGEAKGN